MADRELNRAALVFGLFFCAAGVAFLMERLDVWELRLRHLGPALLIALGVAVLVGGTRHGSSPGS